MKHKVLILALLLPLFLNAQDSSKIFLSFGGSTDLLPMPLIEQPITDFNTLSYHLKFYPIKNFNISLGVKDISFMNDSTHIFEKYKNNITLGLGYTFYHKDGEKLEARFVLSNEARSFKSFRNLSYSLELNSYPCDMMYLGTGLRYTKFPTSSLAPVRSGMVTWYWKIGFYVNMYKKKIK